MATRVRQLGHGGERRRLLEDRQRLGFEPRLLVVHDPRDRDRFEREGRLDLRAELGIEEHDGLLAVFDLRFAEIRTQSRKALEVPGIELGGGVQSVHRGDRAISHDHVVVTEERHTLLEAREHRGGLAETALAHQQQGPIADADRAGVDQLGSVLLHPPVDQGAQR